MKKTLSIIFGAALFLTFAPLSLAEFTVMPSPPHDRQFNFEIQAGQSQESSIVIKNLGGKSITVRLYGADGTNSSQGTFALTSPSQEQKHIGLWTSFAEGYVTIPARSDASVPFTISIPSNATPGNYGGGLAVEALSSEMEGSEEVSGGAVSTSARIYVRAFVQIPGEKINDYEWSNFGFNPKTDSKKSHFAFSFKNNGNTIVIAEPSVSLLGFPPLKESVLTLPQITIQPGTALENIQLRWDDEPLIGYYFVTAEVIFSEFDVLSNTKTNTQTLQRTMAINLTPTYIAVIILVVILGLAGYAIFSYVSARRLKARSKTYKVKQGDTLTSVADSYSVHWKELAKINKLRKPYSLRTGQDILVPPKK